MVGLPFRPELRSHTHMDPDLENVIRQALGDALAAGIMLGRLSRPSGLYELCINELVADANGKIGCVVM